MTSPVLFPGTGIRNSPSLRLDVSYLDVWASKTPRMATYPTRFARSASRPLGTRCSGGKDTQNKMASGMTRDDLPG